MRGILPLGMVAGLAAAGCTTALQTRHVGPDQAQPVQGVLYSLPMATFDVEAQVLVVSCDPSKVGSPDGPLAYELADGTIRSYFVPDPSETYSLDYAKLNSALKTTTAGVTLHPNGMIKTISANIEDRTGEVAGSVVNTALNLYKASVAGQAMPGLQVQGGEKAATGPLAALCGAINKNIRTRNELLVLHIPHARAGLVKETAKETTKESTKETVKVLPEDSAQLAGLEAQLAALTRSLTIKLRLTAWAPTRQASPICKPLDARQKVFLDTFAQRENLQPVTNVSDDARFSLQACVQPLVAAAQPVPGGNGAAAPMARTDLAGDAVRQGAVYRTPAYGKVWVEDTRPSSLPRIETQGPIKLPQFGTKGLVWLENRGFDRNNIEVAFDEDGSMSKLDFGADSRAEHMAGSLSAASASLGEAAELRAKAREARASEAATQRTKAQEEELAGLDHQIAVLERRKQIESLRAGLPGLD
ncbi:hypothetical protein [Castellaniella sp. GW247-6E4]|uniref:hypothetical protein n=1 Tax=Castellaniella sp. GW247-6E4 TaxID=3140380 RepID=UPI003315C0D5